MKLKKIGALIAISTMLFGTCLSVSAEEIQPAGYHIYEVKKIKHWIPGTAYPEGHIYRQVLRK